MSEQPSDSHGERVSRTPVYEFSRSGANLPRVHPVTGHRNGQLLESFSAGKAELYRYVSKIDVSGGIFSKEHARIEKTGWNQIL